MTTDHRTELTLRDIPDADLDQAVELTALSFHLKFDGKGRAHQREVLRRAVRIGAYDGGTLAGMAAAHRLRLAVPGTQLPCAALDFVSVAATHRRRGALTAMLDEMWRRCAAERLPLACLWASESAIYGRFGFGAATEAYRLEIDSSRPLALRITPDGRPLRLLDPAEAPAVLGPFHETQLSLSAGQFGREPEWWRTHVLGLDDSEDDEDDYGPLRVVVLGAAGEPPGGYALYRTRGADDHGPGAVDVQELAATSAPAAAALWTYLAGIDLTTTVHAHARPVDDPLLLFVADRDQVRVTRQEPCLWLRLVDIGAALTARSWAAPVDLVLDVRDTVLPANDGRFRLTAGRPGTAATWTPTTDTADVGLDVRELAACYLGGVPLRRLVRAGLADEHTPSAVRRLDAALETERLPFTGEDY
ncbi:GNAT family N-acetyltransferase [Streptomyces sp. NPDC058000]|uniref:GNAT family N-acetyltransferase n=1 Tax=Streptomyces sp. NPDC058000 TaxID=3346299 RepID=UPI0036EBEB17